MRHVIHIGITTLRFIAGISFCEACRSEGFVSVGVDWLPVKIYVPAAVSGFKFDSAAPQLCFTT